MSTSAKIRVFFSDKKNPALVDSLISTFVDHCKSYGKSWTMFSVENLPKSVNHMYKYMGRNRRLDKWVEEFRASVKSAMSSVEPKWRPIGVSSAIIIMRSPVWVTQKSTIRKMDADNKVKPIFDAIEKATGYPDENHWNFHVFKVPSKRECLTVYLFDLGDVVEYYY